MVVAALLALSAIFLVVAGYYYFIVKNRTKTLFIVTLSIMSAVVGVFVLSSLTDSPDIELNSAGEVVPSPANDEYIVDGEVHIVVGGKIERISVSDVYNIYYIENETGYYTKYSKRYDNTDFLPWVSETNISYDLYLPLTEVHVEEFQPRNGEAAPEIMLLEGNILESPETTETPELSPSATLAPPIIPGS